MNNAKLKQIILKVLKKDDRLWNEDKTGMADKKFGIDTKDQKLTSEFYNR